ncbi:hypothetical protein PIROE2DRAFT_65415 [Piromyces sp. E2]|nr:hypothetical protein PIROE2DRAFT_65415 [Piromyces sp. E2]|eukprot:OUM56682.1 hypothetical protein PIROE2DRAFT_65415 [Piromyces sp. E2]
MKFNNLFTLLLASSAFAYHIQRRDEFGNGGQTLNQSIEANPAINPSAVNPSVANPAVANPATNNISAGNPATNSTTNNNYNILIEEFQNLNTKECQELKDAITKCVNFSFGESFESICDYYYTPECREIVNKDFSSCEYYKKTPGMSLAFARFSCTKDENGKLCPIGDSVFKKNDKEDEIVINETCKSKVCTEQAIQSMKELLNVDYESTSQFFNGKLENSLKGFEKHIAILSEDKCIGKESSGATPLKVGSALLVSFVALLLSRF